MGGEGGDFGGVVQPRADVDAVIATGLLRGGVEGELERGGIHEGGIRVGHGEDGGHAPREGGGGAGVKVFFVRRARFAQVDVDVGEGGEVEHWVLDIGYWRLEISNW